MYGEYGASECLSCPEGLHYFYLKNLSGNKFLLKFIYCTGKSSHVGAAVCCSPGESAPNQTTVCCKDGEYNPYHTSICCKKGEYAPYQTSVCCPPGKYAPLGTASCITGAIDSIQCHIYWDISINYL